MDNIEGRKEDRSRIFLAISGEATYKIKGAQTPPIGVFVNEISKSGLRFVTANLIQPETLLEVTLKITTMSEPIHVIAKVLWQRQLSSRFLSDTCIKFVHIEEKASNKLVKYIHEYAAFSVIDREYVRCSLITDVEFFEIDDEAKKGKCMSADIGVKGMKLFVENIIEPGTRLMLQFSLPDNNPEKFIVKCKVAWSRKWADNVLGIGFDKLPEDYFHRIVRHVETTLSKPL